MLSGVRQNQPQSQPKSTSSSTATTTTSTTTAAPSQVGRGGGDDGASAFQTQPAAAPATAPAAGTTNPANPTGPGGVTRLDAPSIVPIVPPAWSFTATVNAGRAKATRDALQKYVGGDEKAGGRVTPSIIDMLVDGVSTPRTNSIIGQEGVLGRRQALDAARAMASMPQPAYDRISALLETAGQVDGTVLAGASPETERALILKAVAARADALGSEATQERALQELEWFGGAIRGQNRDAVITQTSVVDVDDQVNSSKVNPLDSTVTDDKRADNDGYAQRFTSSCAPAVAVMVRGEADPVFALMLNADGLQNNDPAAGASQLEKQVLERDRFFSDQSPEVQLTPDQMAEFQKSGKLPQGVEHLSGAAVSRVGQQARKTMDDLLDQAVGKGTLNKDQAAALRKDAQGETLTDAEKPDRDAALKAVRDLGGNHPTDFELQAMRGDRPRENFMLIAHALRDLASGVTHQEYWDWSAGQNGMNKTMLDSMEQALAGGLDLPIRLSTPGQDGGHFMMATDVRNQDGAREFLIADPWSGRSVWLKESDFADPKSDWPRREFNVFWKQVTDVFAPLDFPKPENL